MRRRKFLTLQAVLLPALNACANPTGAWRETAPGIGLVVFTQLAPGAGPKEGLQGIGDDGRNLFSHAVLTSRGGATSTYGGASIPRWVDVTWRQDTKGEYWKGGTIVGSHRVQILDRIPKEVLDYARAGPGRALKLKFRIKDDRVLFAWEVEEPSANNQVYVSKMGGGDFQEAKMFNGKVIDPGWER